MKTKWRKLAGGRRRKRGESSRTKLQKPITVCALRRHSWALGRWFSCRAQRDQTPEVPGHALELEFEGAFGAAHVAHPPPAEHAFPVAEDFLDAGAHRR